ncbi:MAG: hypothetical protein ACU0B9_07040 [Limimaricola soesokkakensis]|uniref:hypothetical protein n=1 Tax=Limimaricola soesokkakensis TaxID=1343159 RepID=UPI004057CDE9
MKLTLSPIAGLPGASETTASVAGDVLTVDGIAYDLSSVPEGGEATPEGDDHPFVGTIIRTDGEISAAIRWTYGDDADPHQPRDPAHWVLTVTDGEVLAPVVRAESHLLAAPEEQPA